MLWVDASPPGRPVRSPGSKPNGSAHHDVRHDMSILTGRLRSAELNRVCEDLIALHDGALFIGVQLLVVLASISLSILEPFAWVYSNGLDSLDATHIVASAAPLASGVARVAVLLLYRSGRVKRGLLDRVVLLDVLVRAVERQMFLIPRSRESGDVHAEISSALELALAPLEVGICARYALVHPALAAVLLGQLALLMVSLYDEDAWGGGTRDSYLLVPGMRGEVPVMVCALLSLPCLLHLELVRRAGFLHALWLQALRAEVSHFGLNHLYHATSELDELAEHVRASPPASSSWLVPRLEIAGEQVEQVAQMLKLIVDDTDEMSDAKTSLTSVVALSHFAALLFRGVNHSVNEEAKELHARVPAWVARNFAADALSHARRHTQGALNCELAVLSGEAASAATARGAAGGQSAPATHILRSRHSPPTQAAPGPPLRTMTSSAAAVAPAAPVTLLALRVTYDTGGVDIGLSAYSGGSEGLVVHSAAGCESPKAPAGRRSGKLPRRFSTSCSLPRALRWALPAAARAARLGGNVVLRQDSACVTATLELLVPVDVATKPAPLPHVQQPLALDERAGPSRLGSARLGSAGNILMAVRRSLQHASNVIPLAGGSLFSSSSTEESRRVSAERSFGPAAGRRGRSGSIWEADRASRRKGRFSGLRTSARISGQRPSRISAPAYVPSAPRKQGLRGQASADTSASASRAPSRRSSLPSETHLSVAAAHAAGPGGARSSDADELPEWLRMLPPGQGNGLPLSPQALADRFEEIDSASNSRGASGGTRAAQPAEPPPAHPPGAVAVLDADAHATPPAQPAKQAASCARQLLPLGMPPVLGLSAAAVPEAAASSPPEPQPAKLPHTVTGRNADAAFRAVRADEARARILVVLDNNLDPPSFDGKISGAEVARQLHEMRSEDVTVVMHTGASPAELHALLEAGVADDVTVKDRAGRERICSLCAQHDLCVFVDDMPFVLFALQAAIERTAYGRGVPPAGAQPEAAEPGAAGAPPAARATNLSMRYAMLTEQPDLELLFAICRREKTFDDNVLFW